MCVRGSMQSSAERHRSNAATDDESTDTAAAAAAAADSRVSISSSVSISGVSNLSVSSISSSSSDRRSRRAVSIVPTARRFATRPLVVSTNGVAAMQYHLPIRLTAFHVGPISVFSLQTGTKSGQTVCRWRDRHDTGT